MGFEIEDGVLEEYTEEPGVTKVVIPNGVTSIGGCAFSGCGSLTSIIIPAGVTSIGEYAFSGCSNLTSIIIPDSVTSIGGCAFSGCGSLTSIIIPAGVTSIGEYAFSGCSNLTSIIIPDSVTSIGDSAFSGCSTLTSIVIPDGVTSIGYSVFYGCSSLTSIIIPDSVTSIGYSAFFGCGRLTSVVIPDGVTSIGVCAFSECSNLTSIIISDSVTSIGECAFSSCSSLTSITIPDSVTSIGNDAFCGCSSLTSIAISDGVTSIGGGAFSGCNALADDNGYIIIRGVLYGYCGRDLEVVIPNSVTSIGNGTFWGCSSLTSITIPNSVTSIGDNAFSHCSSLTSIVIPYSVTTIGKRAFDGCSGLKSITIPNSVISIRWEAFAGCSSLTSIAIPNSVMSIGEGAFGWCSSLTSIVIPADVTSIGKEIFTGCGNLLVSHIPLAMLKKTKDKDLWLRAAAEKSADELGDVLKKCPAKLRPDVDQLLAAHALSTEELCAQVKKFPAKLRPYVEMLICTRDDSAAAGYFEKSDRLDIYAAAHNTDADTLRDSLLSDFGLDEKGYRSWPLAGSMITAQLNNDLTITLMDSAGKVLKSVPKKGADEAEYNTAKTELAQLKKDIAAAAKLRNNRLLREFLSGRERDAGEWQRVYLGNPLLRLLARLFVWKQGNNTFTLREDGTACSAAGDDYAIGEMPIALAHPMEMSKEDVSAWQNYFLARGLKQPFEQVWEPVADAAAVKSGRYDGCTVPLYTLMNKEKHGIIMEGQSRITLKDCSAGLRLVEGHHDWVNNEFEITDFKFEKYTRQVNHIVVHLDKATVAGRIKKDDVSIAQWLQLFTVAQITEFIDLAAQNEASNCTALLLDYKNKTYPDVDPLAEFTLDLL